MKNLLSFDKFIYKTIKNFKKVDDHYINGEVTDIKNLILNRRTVVLNFCNNSNNTHANLFKTSSQIINYKNFIKNKIIYYDINLKKLVFNNIIKVWFSNNKLHVLKPIHNLYFNKNYIIKRKSDDRNIFQYIEKKPSLLIYKKRKFLFLYYNILLKINLWQYNKNKLKRFFINFTKDQNKLLLKKQLTKNTNLKFKTIIIGMDKNNVILYTPQLFKISVIPLFTLKKEFRKVLKKWIKKNLINQKKYNMKNLKNKSKQKNFAIKVLRQILILNIFCQIYSKKII